MAHSISSSEWKSILNAVDGHAEYERAGQQRLFRVAQALKQRQYSQAKTYVDDGAPLDVPLQLDEQQGGVPGAKTLVPEHLRTYRHLTVLALVAAEDEPEKLDWLVRQGATVDMVLPDGRDAAWVASEVHANEAYEYLTKHGFPVNAQLSDGTRLSRLMAAVDAVNVDVVYDLLRKKVKVNAYDRTGATALHHNLRRDPYTDEDVTIAQALLNAGANPNIQDNDGIPAHALAEGNEVKQALLQGFELGQITDEVRQKMNPEPEPEYPEGTDPGLPQIKRPQPARPRL